MGKESKLKQSRNHWKKQAVERKDQIRYLRRENQRIKKERSRYKEALRQTSMELKTRKEPLLNSSLEKEELIYISLQLFLVSHIGFNAISRVLQVLSSFLPIQKVPCPQTIINWVTRLSLSRMNFEGNKNQFSKDYLCILDTSIGLGSGKILCVLFVEARHFFWNPGAIKLQDLFCVGVSVSDSWTGEKIASFLNKIFKVVGEPLSYIKDGGCDLSKAARILKETEGSQSHSISDISHVSANFLIHEYQNHPFYGPFLSCCGKSSKNLKQTILACLAPPKVSTKARFMNLHRLVQWAKTFTSRSIEIRFSFI